MPRCYTLVLLHASVKNSEEIQREDILAAQGGSSEAFERIVHAFYLPVFNLLCKWTGNWHDAQDLTQETFLRAYKYIKSFRSSMTFKHWLYRIALNQARDHYSVSVKRSVQIQLDDEISRNLISNGHDPLFLAKQKQAVAQIYDVLRELTERQRTVVVLKVFEGMENSEISGLLGISEVTVRRFYSEARQAIEQKLGARGIK